MTPIPNITRGVDLNAWGPKLFPGGKLYVFKGERNLVSSTWSDAEKIIKHLKNIELFERRVALPDQKKELFERQLEVLTKGLPTDWKLILCAVTSGVVIVVGIFSVVKTQLSKL